MGVFAEHAAQRHAIAGSPTRWQKVRYIVERRVLCATVGEGRRVRRNASWVPSMVRRRGPDAAAGGGGMAEGSGYVALSPAWRMRGVIVCVRWWILLRYSGVEVIRYWWWRRWCRAVSGMRWVGGALLYSKQQLVRLLDCETKARRAVVGTASSRQAASTGRTDAGGLGLDERLHASPFRATGVGYLSSYTKAHIYRHHTVTLNNARRVVDDLRSPPRSSARRLEG